MGRCQEDQTEERLFRLIRVDGPRPSPHGPDRQLGLQLMDRLRQCLSETGRLIDCTYSRYHQTFVLRVGPF